MILRTLLLLEQVERERASRSEEQREELSAALSSLEARLREAEAAASLKEEEARAAAEAAAEAGRRAKQAEEEGEEARRRVEELVGRLEGTEERAALAEAEASRLSEVLREAEETFGERVERSEVVIGLRASLLEAQDELTDKRKVGVESHCARIGLIVYLKKVSFLIGSRWSSCTSKGCRT